MLNTTDNNNKLTLFVVKNGGPALFGRQWLSKTGSPSNTLLQHSVQGDCSNNWRKLSWSLKKFFKVDLEPLRAVRQNLISRKGRLQNFTRPEEYPTQYDQKSTRNCRNYRTKESLPKSIGASGQLRSTKGKRIDKIMR